MDLLKSERFSTLGDFVDVPLFVVLVVTTAIYVVASLLFFHWSGIYTVGDAVEEFLETTIGTYLGIRLIDFVWNSLFD